MIERTHKSYSKRSVGKAGRFLFLAFKILTALKGWVGHAPQGRGALHNCRSCALHKKASLKKPLFGSLRG